MPYLLLGLAIATEVIATSALKASDGFSKLWPSVLVVAGYSVSFYCLSLVLKSIPVGIAYAIWSGLGVALVVTVAALLYKQIPDRAALLGIGLIVAGVLVINLFSKSAAH